MSCEGEKKSFWEKNGTKVFPGLKCTDVPILQKVISGLFTKQTQKGNSGVTPSELVCVVADEIFFRHTGFGIKYPNLTTSTDLNVNLHSGTHIFRFFWNQILRNGRSSVSFKSLPPTCGALIEISRSNLRF